MQLISLLYPVTDIQIGRQALSEEIDDEISQIYAI
jgi:hypothetical protein